ncbi:MAG: hypothetical protein QOD53_548, partial [Thermoleophilaceae bacterium]|nr:hypothetical protein [Thermoleophilaceae bacterium]
PCTGNYVITPQAAPFSITIQGAGAGATFDGGSAHRILSGDATGSNEINLTLRNLTFRNGKATGTPAGAAVRLTNNVSATIDNDRFFGNTAQNSGGAVEILASAGSTPITVINSTFGDGTAAGANSTNNAGAAFLESGGTGPSIVVQGNTFAGNTGSSGVGALYVLASTSTGATATIDDNVFSGNSGVGTGGGALIEGNTLIMRRNTFSANRLDGPSSAFGAFGAGVDVFGFGSGNATITQSGNRFDGNAVTGVPVADKDLHGAGEFLENGQLDSTGDRFTNNSLPAAAGSGEAEGAGLAIEGCDSTPSIPSQIKNLVAAGNTIAGAGHGAGVYVGCNPGPASLTVLDSTISGNQAGAGADSAAGIWGGPDDTLIMRNSIVAGNIGAADVTGFGTLTVSSSDACAPGPFPGAGNICASPFLANPGPGHGDAHETQFSPTIDHGTNALVPAGLTTDFEGDARIVGPAVDMGADEFTQPSVVTGAAKTLRVNRATLNGTVTPNTHATSYHFEYGDTTDYGKSTAPKSLGAGTTLIPVAVPIKGLVPSHSYHFRLVATNSAGTTFGLDGSFKTPVDRWPGVKIIAQKVTVKKGKASVLVSCPKGVGGTCKGMIKLASYGKKKLSLKPGAKKRIKIKLTKKGRRKLARRGSFKVRATAVATDVFATKKTTHGTVKLRLKQHH